MFYIVNMRRPYDKFALGTEGFERIIRDYIINISELTYDQYQTFKGTLYAFDLLRELVPDDTSGYVVGFDPDE